MKRINPYFLILIVVNSIVYHRWLSFSVFTFSDWTFHFREALADLLIPTVWNSTWTSNFGYVDILLWKLPTYLLTGVFGTSGFDYNVAEKFVVFWPIIFGLSIGSFLLVKYVTKSNLGALIGSFVFSFNTYFLSIDTQGHQFLTVGFAFATFAILFFIKLLEERKLYLIILNGISLFLVGIYDLRSLYVVVGILGLYLFYFTFVNFEKVKNDFVKIWGLATAPFIVLFFLSIYWLLPVLHVDALASNSLLGRQIFGSEFYNIQSSLTTFFPFWTGKETAWFTVQQLPWYFWSYPLLAILGLVLNRKNAAVIFFGLIALLGIFLSKQADIPFVNIYGWMYENFPGFNAFREASKFDYMVALGYAVSIGGLVTWIVNQKWNKKLLYGKYLLIFMIAIIPLWNGKPLISGEIKSLFVARTIPAEFKTLNSSIMEQPEYFRTFWINMNNWQIFNNTHPMIDGKLMFSSNWSTFLEEESINKDKSEGEKIVSIFNNEVTDRLLDLSSVKYVIIPLYEKELGNDIVGGFGKTHQYYRDKLAAIKYLKKVDGIAPNILIYENSNFRPHIYTTEEKELVVSTQSAKIKAVDSTAISPSEYRVWLSGIRNPIYLNFSDNYHPSWKVRAGNFNWIDVIINSNYFLSDLIHSKNNAGYNSFYINPQEVCKQFACALNNDGSYDIEMRLFFKPQSYLYLGMIISGITLVLCLSYLVYYGIRKTTKNK